MQRIDGHFRFSPSDLGSFAGCEHLTQLEIRVALGELARPSFASALDEIRKRKGDEHERAYLEALRDAGHRIVEVGVGEDRDWEAAAARTIAAMREGVDYVYQAVLVHEGWRGIADFLERVEGESDLGPYSYEVLDTKLARRPRPAHALQLCFYTEAVAAIQGRAPAQAAVVLGTQERYVLRVADVEAYYRRLRRRFVAATEARPPTEPVVCDHCQYCDFRKVCEDVWEERDHLNRVAGMRRDQIERLTGAGIGTLTALAQAPPSTRVPKLQPETFAGLREQAELQLESEANGRIVWRQRPVEPGRGFQLLPPASPGDVVLDFEGHPWFEPDRGLEFLFGVLVREGDEWRYEATWAHDRAAERAAFERLVDLVHARLAAHPDMHLYHYGSYEGTALKRLMGEYATRELEIDDLLRRRVLCDLYTVLRQALRVGVRSYGLKELEKLAGFVRDGDIGSGGEAVVDYERWLELQDDGLLEQIRAYNEDDCRATLALLEWLRGQRPDGLPWPEPIPPRELREETQEELDEREQLRAELTAGEEPGSPRWLAGELLEYHRRESRPAWWAWFYRLSLSPEELVEDAEAIGCLVPHGEPEESGKSLVWTFEFPEQDHKLSPGDRIADPATQENAGVVEEIDDETRTLRLRRWPKLAETPLPRALVGGKPYDSKAQREALARFARSMRDGDGRYRALEDVLARRPPRIAGLAPGAPVQTTDLDELRRLAAGLDESFLFVQGPPGTGKTWRGARLVCHLLSQGKRVGVTAQSHKVIHNLLQAIEQAAAESGLEFTGVKKTTSNNPESVYSGSGPIENEGDTRRLVDRHAGLVAGTAWLFAREELDGDLDVLVVDEAGQFALADTLACGTAARNLILLGDPLQLAQVSQGVHPLRTGASALAHLLGADATVPEERGVFLDRSFRMHPDVCAFVSELVYAGRLGSDEGAAARSTSFGTGIRFQPVAHAGNASSSDEEVAVIRERIGRMLGGDFVDGHGARPLRESDIMVVAPYNAQVDRLRAALPAGVQVGTVDKFQGREAPVVFFSMATSSGDDVPRNLAFLFSRNRLNVAVSRAQCLAVLVCSPRLLEARCRSIEEMQLVNALCRLVEVAEEQRGSLP